MQDGQIILFDILPDVLPAVHHHETAGSLQIMSFHSNELREPHQNGKNLLFGHLSIPPLFIFNGGRQRFQTVIPTP